VSSVLSIVTAPLELFIRLRDEIIRYQTSRKARERLFNALNYEVKVYNDKIDRISDLGKKAIPLLRSLKEKPAISKFNKLLLIISPFPILCMALVDAFIATCKRCRSIEKNEAFMHHLFFGSPILYDFVKRMANTYEAKDTVRIGEDYYTFFSLYEDEILKDVKESDMEGIVKEARSYIEAINRFALKTRRINRVARRAFIRNFSRFHQEISKKVIFEGTIIDIKHYVPRKLLPVIILLEEISIT